MTSATQKLRDLLSQNTLSIAPGVFDGLSARLAERADFSLLYASGGAIARSYGYPDLGLLSVTEVCGRLSQIVEATSLPVIADADTGFGNALNVRRTVRLFERVGVAALHLEDQQFPKRCGHLAGKSLISTAEMVGKVRAARDILWDPDFVLIARTDAIAVEGFSAAMERAHAYLAAGADMIFVEAPETMAQIEAIAAQISQPKLINMFSGGKTPEVEIEQLRALGYRIVIIPSDLQRAAIFAMEKILMAIREQGNSKIMAHEMTSFKEREVIVGTQDYINLSDQYQQ